MFHVSSWLQACGSGATVAGVVLAKHLAGASVRGRVVVTSEKLNTQNTSRNVFNVLSM